MCLHLFVHGVQHLEYRTGCLKSSVAFLTTMVSLECMVLVTSLQFVVSSMCDALCVVCNIRIPHRFCAGVYCSGCVACRSVYCAGVYTVQVCVLCRCVYCACMCVYWV